MGHTYASNSFTASFRSRQSKQRRDQLWKRPRLRRLGKRFAFPTFPQLRRLRETNQNRTFALVTISGHSNLLRTAPNVPAGNDWDFFSGRKLLQGLFTTVIQSRTAGTGAYMGWVRNLLISVGAYWISLQLAAFTSLLLFKLLGGLHYGGSVFSAIAMGMVDSMGLAVCAGFGAAIVTLSAASLKPERWALIVALLYVVAGRLHFHWYQPPTTWDRVSEVAGILWPAVVCIATAMLLANFKRKRVTPGASELSSTPSQLL